MIKSNIILILEQTKSLNLEDDHNIKEQFFRRIVLWECRGVESKYIVTPEKISGRLYYYNRNITLIVRFKQKRIFWKCAYCQYSDKNDNIAIIIEKN